MIEPPPPYTTNTTHTPPISIIPWFHKETPEHNLHIFTLVQGRLSGRKVLHTLEYGTPLGLMSLVTKAGGNVILRERRVSRVRCLWLGALRLSLQDNASRIRFAFVPLKYHPPQRKSFFRGMGNIFQENGEWIFLVNQQSIEFYLTGSRSFNKPSWFSDWIRTILCYYLRNDEVYLNNRGVIITGTLEICVQMCKYKYSSHWVWGNDVMNDTF